MYVFRIIQKQGMKLRIKKQQHVPQVHANQEQGRQPCQLGNQMM